MRDTGRDRHFSAFYGLDPLPDGPLAVVHGNCQAEAVRVLLAGSSLPLATVRVPPVHELTAEDLPHLDAVLARTGLLLSQPVRADYRGLPLGTAQVGARLPAGARVLTWPVVRYTGLHPWQALIRPPAAPGLSPPVVPYHDLRTLAEAAGLRLPVAGPDVLRESARRSVASLAAREQRTDVGVSDLLAGADAGTVHTLNHPGNPLLRALAARLLAAAGHPGDVPDPGRVLLGGVRAPLEPGVLDALGLDAAPRPHWLVAGIEVDDAEVRAAQLAWYAESPAVVTAGLSRHAEQLTLLGAG